MSTESLLFKIITISLFLFWQFYWIITEKKANREKPKLKKTSLSSNIEKHFTKILGIILFTQLFIWNPFLFPATYILNYFGLLMVVVGILISIIARIELGNNWAHAAEYQIKQNHELITSGIYHYIRHPIYTGLTVAFTGAEIVAHSYLCVFFFFLILCRSYLSGKREEVLLCNYFGEKYQKYMKETKMFIPYFI